MNVQPILDSLDAALQGVCVRIEKLTDDYSPTNHTLLTACLEALQEVLEARAWVEANCMPQMYQCAPSIEYRNKMNETLLKMLSGDPWRNAKPYKDGDIAYIPDEHDAPCEEPADSPCIVCDKEPKARYSIEFDKKNNDFDVGTGDNFLSPSELHHLIADLQAALEKYAPEQIRHCWACNDAGDPGVKIKQHHFAK